VYGGDGVTQNCTLLAHLHKFSLGNQDHLMMCSPLVTRRGSTDDRHRLWYRVNYCGQLEVIPSAEGEALAQAVLLEREHQDKNAKKRATDYVDQRRIAEMEKREQSALSHSRLSHQSPYATFRKTTKDEPPTEG